MDDERDAQELQRYKVVVNDEDQYSIWPSDWENALGWHDEGYSGSKPECLAHIQDVWQDMRPRSVCERLAGVGNGAQQPSRNGAQQR
jgi:MbtH protein